MAAPPHGLGPQATALSLMLAVIASSNTPLLLLDGDLHVIAASASFCHDFQIEPASVPRSRFSGLGRGEWAAPQLSSLLESTASGAGVAAYEFDLIRDGQAPRHLVINAQKLDYVDKEQVRLLLAIADVTEALGQSKAPGQSSAREGHSPPGGPAPYRQQPADHRQHPPAERPQGAVG